LFCGSFYVLERPGVVFAWIEFVCDVFFRAFFAHFIFRRVQCPSMPHTIITSRGDQLKRGMARTTQVFAHYLADLPFAFMLLGKLQRHTNTKKAQNWLMPEMDTHIDSNQQDPRGKDAETLFQIKMNRIRSPFAAIGLTRGKHIIHFAHTHGPLAGL